MATIYTRAAKGSALTWTEGDANITNLNNDKIEAVSEDTSPSLGGDLNVNGFNITTNITNGDIDVMANGTGQIRLDATVVGVTSTFSTNGANNLVLNTNGGTNSGNITITAGVDGDISITPNGTGAVIIDGNEFPQTTGLAGQVLTADGSGLVEWKLNQTISAQVYNADSVTINKGEPVYVFGSTGSNISVKRALNTGDATSAQTLGLAGENIAAGSTGIVICQGLLTGVDTSSYTAGQALYLGATAGTITTTKPKAPNHLVYLGFAETINAVSGRIYVRTQNGYELDEIHDVNINGNVAITNKDYLVYNSSNSLWENRQLDIVNDSTPQLGGNLDLNGNGIVNNSVGTPHISLTAGDGGDVIIEAGALIPKEGILLNTADLTIAAGSTYQVKLQGITYPKTDGSANQFLKTNGSGVLSFASITQATGNELEAVADDPAPQLGGNLNVGVYSIVSSSNGNIAITPNGTGKVVLDGLSWPTADGTNNQVLKTDGAGNLSFTTITSGIATVSADTTPSLGGNLTVAGFSIVSTSNGNIALTPNGTGQTVVKNLEYNENIHSLGTTSGTITPDAANGNVQTITLNGNLTFSAFSNPVAGQSITLIVNTNGTNRTLTSTMKFSGGTKTLSITSTTDIISVFYDGTTYWASLATDFK